MTDRGYAWCDSLLFLVLMLQHSLRFVDFEVLVSCFTLLEWFDRGLSSDSVYDADTNAIYSLITGLPSGRDLFRRTVIQGLVQSRALPLYTSPATR